MGFEAAGLEIAWQVEIDKDAVSVLERHYPSVTRYRDVTTVDPVELEAVDVVVFGSPCQDMSVAGKRAGLAGERSGLFYEAVRVIGRLRPAPTFCVWENVAGALSSFGGRDFGAALDALADIGALDIAWRVLDAQFWGVAQRRRRVFLVADFRGERAASVLFESPCLSGHSPASGAAREGVAAVPASGAGGGGVSDVAYALRHNTNGSGNSDNAWNTTYVPVSGEGVADTVRPHPRPGSNSLGNVVAAPLTVGGHPNSNEPGRHREDGENIVVAAFDPIQITSLGYRGTVNPEAPCHTLHTSGMAIAFHATQTPVSGHVSPALGASSQIGIANLGVYPTLSASEGGTLTQIPPIMAGSAVRRLTPTECARLQGFPDEWVKYRANGSVIPDGSQYRLLGNAVCVPVARWIGTRLCAALEATT